MRIMGVSGMPGSGKSFISDIACERGAIMVSMGDIIREEAKKRGEPSKETAKNLRKEFGNEIVAERTIEKIKKLLEEGVDSSIVVDGIRSHHEVKLFRKNFEDFIIVSVFANSKIRFERIKARNREDDTDDYAVFEERDENELGFGIGNVISLSDKLLINESNLDSYIKEIHEFMEEYDV